MKFLICIDAGSQIGAGHLTRCKILAKELIKNHATVDFFIGGISKSNIDNNGISSISVNEKLICNVCDKLIKKVISKSYDIVIIDVIHAQTLNKLNEFLSALHEIKKYTSIVLIDSFGEFSLRSKSSNLTIDAIIAPYVGEKTGSSFGYKVLAGPKYYILDPEFYNIKSKKCHDDVNNILVTCGGADSQNISYKILTAINEIKQKNINIRCIIGPYFSNSNVRQLVKLSKLSEHKISLIYHPDNLINHIKWCDIAIATSGLTKYELAAGRAPSILISIDEEHNRINQEYMKTGAAIDLGNNNNVSSSDIMKAIEVLINNKDIRSDLIEKSTSVIDCFGVRRVCEYLIEHSDRVKQTA